MQIKLIFLLKSFLDKGNHNVENNILYVKVMIMFTSTLALVLYSLTDYTLAGYGAMRLYWLIMGICAVGICCMRSSEK